MDFHYDQIEVHSEAFHFEIWPICLPQNSKKLLQKFQENFTQPGHFSYLKHDNHTMMRWLLEKLSETSSNSSTSCFVRCFTLHSFSFNLSHPLTVYCHNLAAWQTDSPFITSLCIFRCYDDPKCCSFTQEHIISTANEKWKLPKVKHCRLYTFIDLRKKYYVNLDIG